MVSPQVVMGFEWSFLILAHIAVAARLYVRTIIRRDRLHWSDGWLLVALIAAQGLLICDTLTYHKQDMNNFTDPDVPLMKIRFATNYFFDFGIYFPKFSIIALYYKLVPPTRPTMRKFLHVLAAITVMSSLTTFFADTFWCGPDLSVNWKLGGCSTWASMHLMRLNWSLNFSAEIINLLFPFPLISDLKLSSLREKFSLGLIFAMGFITVGVSVGRFVTMLYVSNAISVYIWATVEFCTSIIIVAMTALKPLLKTLTRAISSSLHRGDINTAYRISTNEYTPGSRRTNRSDAEMGMFWNDRGTGSRSQVSTSHQGDGNESELELNSLGSMKIIKTEEVVVSSEVIGGSMGKC